MASKPSISLCVLTSLFAALIGTSTAYKFYVGGTDGWVLRPSENYNQWAERMRFQVNDTLLFKYKNGEDSVLIVNKGDYDNCKKQNPIQKLDGGDSVFMFDRSGSFYFISGHFDNCEKGQKLLVVVMAVRNKFPQPAPFPGSAPSPLVHAPPPSALAPATNVPEMGPSQGSLPSPVDNSTSPPPPPPPPSRSEATAVCSSVVLVLFLMGGIKFGFF
ncbi:early nodulin-like protein 1 [Impatiens glandulifera]|uniref:early nodulin-like protein 1 n=1 Tax=Impatiens glandulifera TaxID=253017 RepID=UPI001FB08478|nr:early nodulin-like protein 1 [Impatiens glandulifera]